MYSLPGSFKDNFSRNERGGYLLPPPGPCGEAFQPLPGTAAMKGVVAVLGGEAAGPVGSALEGLIREGLGGVEIRADLFADPGAALARLRELPRGLPALFTVRTRAEGGSW